tara:strand:- start:10886 stop:11443 length:558 start_codon:yes stop_codon:yes gene_type:complete
MKLALKGKRNYLTGADIINFSLKKVIKRKNVVFNFHKFSKKFLVIKKFDYNKKIPKKNIVSTIVTFSQKKKTVFQILELDKIIKEKKIFDENKLLQNYKINKRSITQNKNNKNFFDTIVALNKELLNTKIVKNNWIFCKLEMKNLNKLRYKKIKIKLEDDIKKKFYKSSIYLDNKIIGFIYFIKK